MPIHGYPGNVITANPTAPTSSVATGVWTTEQQLIAVAAGNWPFTIPTQQISRSLRFNSADTAYLSRTLGTSNRRTFTFSAWLKRSLLASTQCVFGNINYAGGGSTNQQFFLGFTGSDQLDMFHYNNGTQNQVTSTAVYRDPSAWYHIVGAVDTTQATSSNRLKIYVNGSQITTLTTATYPTQNTDTFINANLATGIGRQEGTGISGSYFFSGYMTEIYFVDGQALTPSSFGRNNIDTGVWEPLAYTGTYGTNGFYLNFSDNSNTTAATLGKDYSGNGNNWTPNNFSVTAGAGNDSMVDSPTPYGTDTGAGGEVRGNYATLNPLDWGQGSDATFSDGNLRHLVTNTTGRQTWSTLAIPDSGKWYFEATYDVLNSSQGQPVVAVSTLDKSIITVFGLGVESTGGYLYRYTSGAVSAYTTVSAGDTFMFAIDRTGQKAWIGKNGTWLGSGNPSAGTNPAEGSLVTAGPYLVYNQDRNNSQTTFNFGQRAFAYTAPSGFKALCTTNLPTPTIGATSTTQADNYFGVSLYTGTGSQQSITGLEFQPDFFWSKGRSAANAHILINAVSGPTKFLSSNNTDAEVTTTNGTLVSFNSNGVTLQADTNGYANFSGRTYVGWNWRASNAAGVTNTAGTITSTVSANTTSGFSIVTWTGTGVNATVGHGLGAVPGMIIAKRRSATQNWGVAHSALTGTQTLYLDLVQGAATGVWNGTPTSTVFNITTDGVVNASGSTYVAYCFAPVAGYSAFGGYTGNGSSDGPFIYTGFRPRFVMYKAASGSTFYWSIYDTARDPYNVPTKLLYPNTSNAEDSPYLYMDILSNGFKIRAVGNLNENGSSYVYACFAENPFKYSLAR